MWKENVLRKKAAGVFFLCILPLFAATLFNSCATIELDGRYRSMVAPASSAERVVGRISFLENERICTEARHAQNARMLGWDMATPSFISDTRHSHEPILDRMLSEAQRRFPNEQIAIRNASVIHRHTNPRTVRQGQQSWTEWYCSDNFFAYIVTSEPLPQPVTLLETITVTEGQIGNIIASDGSVLGQVSFAQVTRGDLYRRAHNWLSGTRAVEIRTAQFDLGRISGHYAFIVDVGHDIRYRIVTFFTIDVHDARAQIRFDNTTILQDASTTSPGGRGSGAILFQSIADAAHAELVRFSGALISRMTSSD